MGVKETVSVFLGFVQISLNSPRLIEVEQPRYSTYVIKMFL